MQEQNLTKTTTRRRTRPRRTEDDKRERRCDERVLLDRVALIVSKLSPGGPPDDPFWDRPKTPQMGPGLPGAQNRQIVSKDSIKKLPDSEGRRIRGFCPLGTRLDLVPFRVPPGTVSRVGFLLGLVASVLSLAWSFSCVVLLSVRFSFASRGCIRNLLLVLFCCW